MKITFIANHFCIRATKQAIALRKRGHKVYGIGFRKPQFFDNLNVFFQCKTINQFREAVRIIDSKTDVYYVHTEPYYYVWILRELSTKPIVLDMHDSMQWRVPNKYAWKSAEERSAITMVDAIVVPSNRCKQLTPTDKPVVVLPPYVNEQFIQYTCTEWLGGLVYEGRADKKADKSYMRYCKYHELSAECLKNNLPFYIYSPWKDNKQVKEYKDAIVMPPQDYKSLLIKLSSHDWGLCGNTVKTREWNLAMPNKLFEYMAAGIPIVSINAAEVSKFVKKYKVGISVKSISELKERWDEREECQKNVLKIRHNFTMERNIGPLDKLFREILRRAQQ